MDRHRLALPRMRKRERTLSLSLSLSLAFTGQRPQLQPRLSVGTDLYSDAHPRLRDKFTSSPDVVGKWSCLCAVCVIFVSFLNETINEAKDSVTDNVPLTMHQSHNF